MIKSFSHTKLASMSCRNADSQYVAAQYVEMGSKVAEHQTSGASNRSAWIAGYITICIAFVLLIAMLTLSSSGKYPPPLPGSRDLSSPVGWIGQTLIVSSWAC
jgi:hypothetical protein